MAPSTIVRLAPPAAWSTAARPPSVRKDNWWRTPADALVSAAGERANASSLSATLTSSLGSGMRPSSIVEEGAESMSKFRPSGSCTDGAERRAIHSPCCNSPTPKVYRATSTRSHSRAALLIEWHTHCRHVGVSRGTNAQVGADLASDPRLVAVRPLEDGTIRAEIARTRRDNDRARILADMGALEVGELEGGPTSGAREAIVPLASRPHQNLSTDGRRAHRPGSHVHAEEKVVVERPPLVLQVGRVALKDKRAPRASVPNEQLDVVECTLAAARVAVVAHAFGERLVGCVTEHRRGGDHRRAGDRRGEVGEGTVDVVKDCFVLVAPEGAPWRINPARGLKPRLPAAARWGETHFGKPSDGVHARKRVVHEGGVAHGEAVPRRRLETHAPAAVLGLSRGADKQHALQDAAFSVVDDLPIRENQRRDTRDLGTIDLVAVGQEAREHHRQVTVVGADGAARVFTRVPAVFVVVDAQAIAAVGVCHIVGEHAERNALRAYARGLGRALGETVRPDAWLEPEAVVLGAGRHVADVRVVAVCDPKRRWRLVRVEQSVGGARQHAKVADEGVLGLDAVLQKECVPHHVVSHVVVDAQVVYAVERDGTVVGAVERDMAQVRLAHVADHVEVQRVAP
eukprot:scaffold25307_cov109-Isochrysis_galbana.AAC.7